MLGYMGAPDDKNPSNSLRAPKLGAEGTWIRVVLASSAYISLE